MKNRNCVVCGSGRSSVIYRNYPGYVEGSFFDIYRCGDCNSHFIACDGNIEALYETIYRTGDTYGYDRYLNYMNTVKSQKDPLRYLAYEESVYYPVYKYLKNKRNLDILDVGCGYGYLTYALRKKGFNAWGIDISANAVAAARREFGDYFFNQKAESFADQNRGKFDLIIATELLEHLNDPEDLICVCRKMLKNGGRIILTTPNKDYYRTNAVWMTDLPPVHISWIGKKGIEIIAERNNLKPVFEDFSKYYSRQENRLIRYYRTRNEPPGIPALTKDGAAVFKGKGNQSLLYKTVVFCLHRLPFVRTPSNFIHNILINKEATLAVILE